MEPVEWAHPQLTLAASSFGQVVVGYAYTLP